MSVITKKSISTSAPTPTRWPGEKGFFYAEPPATIGEVLEAYPFVRTTRSWGAILLSLVVGGGGGFLLAGVAHAIFERGDADFYGTIAAMFLGGPLIAFGAYMFLRRFTPFSSEAVFVGTRGVASHTVSWGRQTERVVLYDPARRPQKKVEIAHGKGGQTEWPVLFWDDGGELLEVRVKHLIPMVELAYEDHVTP